MENFENFIGNLESKRKSNLKDVIREEEDEDKEKDSVEDFEDQMLKVLGKDGDG